MSCFVQKKIYILNITICDMERMNVNGEIITIKLMKT